MRWDGESKSAVNRHFASITELHRTTGYIGNLSIEDVLKSVLMATLKASTDPSLRDTIKRSWMTSMTKRRYLSRSSKTLAPASFDATLTTTTWTCTPRRNLGPSYCAHQNAPPAL